MNRPADNPEIAQAFPLPVNEAEHQNSIGRLSAHG